MSRADFARINEEAAKRGDEAYANPRNLTAGSLKQLDPRMCAKRHLRLFAYSMGLTEVFERKFSGFIHAIEYISSRGQS